MSEVKLRPLARCGVASSQHFREFVAANVIGWIAACERAGLTQWDIAVRVGVHRSTVNVWKGGRAENMYAAAYVALEALAAEVTTKKAVGT